MIYGRARQIIVKGLQTTRLNKIAHRLYYDYVHGFDTSHKYLPYALDRSFNHAMRLGTTSIGDYYEFGVFKGYSLWHAISVAQKCNLTDMRFFGFDSFRGLPKPQGIDCTMDKEFYERQYACSKGSVIRNLNRKGVDWGRTQLIEGFFNESLNASTKTIYRMNKIAIALIDCDLYSSTTHVLDFIPDMIIDNSILMFDDWNCFNGDEERGQKRAFREFLEANRSVSARKLFSYGMTGQVFTVHL